MRKARVANVVASMLRLFSLAFLVPAAVALVYEPGDVRLAGGLAVPRNTLVFVAGFLLTNLAVAPVSYLTRRSAEEELLEREGFLTGAVAWLLMPLFAALPFLLSGLFRSPLDAYFEAMSGVTTTGFTVLPVAADDVAPSLVFWRGLLLWIGGIGIIVLTIAVLSRLAQGGVQLIQAESPVHASKRLRPKLADTARALLGVYLLVSLALFALLYAAIVASGVGWRPAVFEAVVHLFAGFATGGFSSHAASVLFFDSVWVEAALVVVMVAGCTNFQLLVAFRRGDWRTALRDGEWRFYLASLALAALAVAAVLAAAGHPVADALRHGTFTTVSLFTTTGFSTVDYSHWPVPALVILLAAMFVGGSSGSTGGALKTFRVLLAAKLVRRELKRLIHPRAVIPVRFAGRPVAEGALAATAAFMFGYMVLWVAGTLAIAALEPDASALEAAGASAASLGNVGAAFGPFGPAGSIAELGAATKAVMMALMWFGRLEIFTALLLFYPSSWRN